MTKTTNSKLSSGRNKKLVLGDSVVTTTSGHRYYIGTNPPAVAYATDNGLSYKSEHEAKCDAGDYMPSDDQPWDKE